MIKIRYLNSHNSVWINLVLLLSILVSLAQLLKFLNFNSNIYDTGVEIHNTFKIFNNNFDSLFQGHFKPLQLIFSQIFFIKNLNIEFFIFFFLQSIAILIPVIFFKEFRLRILYLSNPLTWIFLMGDFHYDYFLIPAFLIIFFLFEKNKKKNLLMFSSMFFLIKEFFMIFPILIGLIESIKTKKLKWIFFLIFSIIISFFIFYEIGFIKKFFEFYKNVNNQYNIIAPEGSYYIKANFKNLLFFFFIIINFLIFVPNYFHQHNFFFLSVIGAIYILFSLGGFKFGLFSHYYLPFFLIMICYPNYQAINKFFKIRIFFSLVVLFLFSISPVSFNFLFSKLTFPFSLERVNQNLSSHDDLEKIKKIDFKKKKVVSSNNFLIPGTIKTKSLHSFPATDKIILSSDFIIISKKVYSYYDKFCFNIENCEFKDEYLEKINLVVNNFTLVLKTSNYNIYKQ